MTNLNNKFIGNEKKYLIETLKSKTSFVKKLETTCVETVEGGSMTKDLAILVGPSTKYLNTSQFLDELDGNLKKKLN